MKCPREILVLDAVRTGEWTPALRQHVASCEECAAAADVAQWMEGFASNGVPRRNLPDPALLWLQAQLPPPANVAQKVGRPVKVVQIAAYFIAVGASTVLLVRHWNALQAWVSSFTAAGIVETPWHSSIPLLLFAFSITSFAATLAVHTILADEG